MHVLPRVREIHERLGDDLVVIGVHAGKFSAERQTERIRTAMARLGVRHAVVNDRQFRVWRAFGVQAWPTVVIVSPDGHVLATLPGEVAVEEVVGILMRARAAYAREGLLDRSTPAPLFVAPEEPDSQFRFPGRLVRDGSRLYVSDTGHHRVVELRLLEGRACPATGPVAMIERTWGCGDAGLVDGSLQHVCFNEPWGLARAGTHLYVADRRNHAIRSIDLSDGSVTTVAGTGELGAWEIRSGPALKSALRSPWGLLAEKDRLLIAMAGSHQVWSMTLDGSDLLEPVAGSGGEGIADGAAATASFAQPTGLASNGSAVFVADCESSAVREISSAPPQVRTIVGTGLFDFGDRDAAADRALLQHPQDLAWHDGRLYVADTYNDKIKVVHPDARTSVGMIGDAGGGSALQGPAGIAPGEGCLYVADTDTHRIVSIDVDTGNVRPLEID